MDFTQAELANVRRQVEDEYGPGVPEELVLLEAEDMKRKGCVDLSLDDCRKCPSSENCPVLAWTERNPEYKDDDFAKTLNALRAKAKVSWKNKCQHQSLGSTLLKTPIIVLKAL